MRILVVMLVACGATSEPPKSEPPRNDVPKATLTKDDQVFEAVFLHDLAGAGLKPNEAVCLVTRGATTDGKDLYAAVKAKYPTTVLDSECAGGGPQGPVVLAKTGGPAVRLDIGPVEWQGEVAKIVSGGAYRGGGARETEYTVEKQSDGSWKVTNEKLLRVM
jgi:hypothetical protein